jgi:hypothetical protein
VKTKILIGVVFVGILGGGGGKEVNDYIQDKSILENPARTIAKVIEHNLYSKTRKGVTTDSHNFRYEYEVEGKKYYGSKTLVNESGEALLKEGDFEVLYKQGDPKLHKSPLAVDSGRTIGGLIITLLKIALFAIVMAFVIGGILAAKLGWLKKSESESSAV